MSLDFESIARNGLSSDDKIEIYNMFKNDNPNLSVENVEILIACIAGIKEVEIVVNNAADSIRNSSTENRLKTEALTTIQNTFQSYISEIREIIFNNCKNEWDYLCKLVPRLPEFIPI